MFIATKLVKFLVLSITFGALGVCLVGCIGSNPNTDPLQVWFETLTSYNDYVESKTHVFENEQDIWGYNADSAQSWVLQIHDSAQWYNQALRRQGQQYAQSISKQYTDSLLDLWRSVELKKLDLEYRLFVYWNKTVCQEQLSLLREWGWNGWEPPEFERGEECSSFVDSVFRTLEPDTALQNTYLSVLQNYAAYSSNISEALDLTVSRKQAVMETEPQAW